MTNQRDPETTLLIGDLVFDRARREIRRGDEVIVLPRLSYRLFECLLHAAPGIVTQEALVDAVWDGRPASPETVTQRVKLLRDSLGDDAKHPRYIGLVRGQGYRIVARVRAAETAELSGETPLAAARRSYALPVLVALALLTVFAAGLYFQRISPAVDEPTDAASVLETPPNSVAVIPFDSQLDEESQFFTAGLSDALRDQLGRMGGLQVAARTSSIVFDEGEGDAVSIAARLGVRNLIEGSVQQSEDSWTISLSLVDGATGYLWWSEEFETDEAGLPETQARIARQLMQQLLPDRQFSVAASHPDSLNPTANRLLQRARQLYQQVRAQAIVDEERLDQAIGLFRRAIELDPRSALAQVRLAQALMYAGRVDEADAAISRARAIDPDLAEVQYTLGLYRWMTYEPGSGAAQQRAIELDPNHADAQEAYAKWIWHQLYSDRPEAHFRRALEVDPASLNRYADLGNYYGMSGQREKAIAIAQQIPVLFSDASAYMVIARILELTGDLDQAIAWALRAHETEPGREETAWMIAELYARIGDIAKAHDYEPGPSFNLLYWARDYDAMIELGEELVFDRPHEAQLWFGLAFAATAMNEHAKAIRYLRTQGIPERVFSENRRANEEEALITLANALKESSDGPRAKELVAWFRPFLIRMIESGGDQSWWPYAYLACVDSILDRHEDALAAIERLPDTLGMPWHPLLTDAPCLRRYRGDPRYDEVVTFYETRKRELREGLPSTLARLRSEWRDEGRVASAD